MDLTESREVANTKIIEFHKKMEDVTLTVNLMDITDNDAESIEVVNKRFIEFQCFLELKKETKDLRYKLHRDFVVSNYHYSKTISAKIDVLTTTEDKLVNYLVDEKIYFCVQGQLITIADKFNENHKCVETTYDHYLENNIGFLTRKQINHLYCEHDFINMTHRELYGMIEYEKATRG
jgi:hypothetical protein